MGYFNSLIKLRQDGLYQATIRYSYFYIFTSEEHQTFKTLGEAKDWVLSKRCPEHTEEISEESIVHEEEETSPIEGNAFENDSDDEPLSDSDTDCESTEQERNVRLNRFMLNEELKKKKPTIINNRKCKKWNVRFQNK